MELTDLKEKKLHNIPKVSQWRLGIADIQNGLSNWRIWAMLSWQDIKLRYRRSTLGPLWITISMAITIYSMGFLYGVLFKMDLSKYYPFLATGMLSWSLLSTLICESTITFMESESFLKQMKQPYSMFIFRGVLRNFIIFSHNILVLIPIIFIFHLQFSLYSLTLLLGLAIIWINAVTYGTILAILGSRYRDLTQLVNSFVQVVFFITPIIWSPTLLPQRYHFIAIYNPFAQFVELIRNPLLNLPLTKGTVPMVAGITFFGLICSLGLFIKYRSRIVYWL